MVPLASGVLVLTSRWVRAEYEKKLKAAEEDEARAKRQKKDC